MLLARAVVVVEPIFATIVADFYARIAEQPQATTTIREEAEVEHQRATLEAWLRRFFTSPRDAAYCGRAVELGENHLGPHVPPRYVVAGMNLVRTALERRVREASPPDQTATLVAIHRALDLDLAIFVEAQAGAELRRAEDAARQVALKRKERVTSAGILAAGLAHEFRNPLNGAQLHLTFLRRRLASLDGIDPAILEATDVAGSEIKRLSTLVTELLAVAIPAPLELTPTDLREVCIRACGCIEEDATSAGVDLNVQLPESRIETIADGQKLTEVLVRVLRNSLEAIAISAPSDARAARGRIVLSAHKSSDSCVIEVEDSGPGIVDPDAPLFEPFFTTKPKGSGLGLSIAHRIVSDHDGSLTFSSTPGCTVFSIKLPAAELGESRRPT